LRQKARIINQKCQTLLSLISRHYSSYYTIIYKRELKELGFKIELVLGDNLYNENSTFLQVLEELKLEYLVSIRNNHEM
jgi:hypothetical protein